MRVLFGAFAISLTVVEPQRILLYALYAWLVNAPQANIIAILVNIIWVAARELNPLAIITLVSPLLHCQPRIIYIIFDAAAFAFLAWQQNILMASAILMDIYVIYRIINKEPHFPVSIPMIWCMLTTQSFQYINMFVLYSYVLYQKDERSLRDIITNNWNELIVLFAGFPTVILSDIDTAQFLPNIIAWQFGIANKKLCQHAAAILALCTFIRGHPDIRLLAVTVCPIFYDMSSTASHILFRLMYRLMSSATIIYAAYMISPYLYIVAAIDLMAALSIFVGPKVENIMPLITMAAAIAYCAATQYEYFGYMILISVFSQSTTHEEPNESIPTTPEGQV